MAMVKRLEIFTAFVRGGRLVLDADPASLGLTEGESIDLVDVYELSLQGGRLSEEDEQSALDRALECSIGDTEAGLTIDFNVLLADLREKAKRSSSRVVARSRSLRGRATRYLPLSLRRWLERRCAHKTPQAKE
jgi:hypothetical protein